VQENPPHPTREAANTLAVRFLRVGLFYKILVSNVGLLLFGAAAGMLVVRTLSPEISMSAAFLRFGLVAVAFLVLGTLIHTYLVRAALSPLRILEQTARRVEAGDVDARAEESPLSDQAMTRVVRVFNSMLDTLGAHRLQERARSARTLEAHENERFKTSRELYDHLAQTLAGVLVRLRGITDAKQEPHVSHTYARLAEVRTEVQEALERARDLARRLHPPELEELGLDAAINADARVLRESSGLEIEVNTSRPLPWLGAEPRLAAFRIVQEALRNIEQHANARGILVGLEIVNGHLEVEIRDDGQGFDPDDDTVRRKGFGIDGMIRRAADSGGALSIQSHLGKGTVVSLTIPIVRSESPNLRHPEPFLESERSSTLGAGSAVEKARHA
jgi:signal transduction histidine kinase